MNDFFIGFDRGAEPPTKIELEPQTLLRHMMALGSSGSGKTVLCKVVTEEILRSGLPTIAIDPQGDLCSLALHVDDPEFLRDKGVDPALAAEFAERVDPVIFTPASRKGIALSADPVGIDVEGLKARDRVYAISSIATMVVSLLGYELDSDDGLGLVAVCDRALSQLQKRGHFPRNLEEFTDYFIHLDETSKEELSRYLDVKKIDHACQRLARLDVGARRLLFHEGLALDIDLLLGLGDSSAAVEGKARLSVIYLNTLHSQEDKEFFVAALTERLYTWMLRNPSKEPQALFYIDEVAPFIPPVRKPACKPALQLLFKQARKYGVCCLMATQNPADVDYKAMAQFGTWAIGRLTTRQDMKKVQPTVKSLDPVNVDAIMKELPSQKPGQFVLISPDNFDRTPRLQCRWLYTEHETLDDRRIEELMDELARDRFDELEREAEEPEVVTLLDAGPPVESEPLPSESAPVPVAETPSAAPTNGNGAAKRRQPADSLNETTTIISPEIDKDDRRLARFSSASVKQFAVKSGVSDGKARTRLKKLVAAGRASQYKEGREHRYWSLSTGLCPHLGLDHEIDVLVARVTQSDAERIGREMRGRSFLGLVGDDEEVSKLELEYRLVMKLGFTEKVMRSLFKRIFGPSHDEMLDNVYLHPGNLKIVVFNHSDGIRLEDRPEEFASNIDDFDGVVGFETRPPASVPFREADLEQRHEDQAIKASFQSRYKASPSSVKPIFLPVWNLHLQRRRGATRIVTIDAISGKPLEW